MQRYGLDKQVELMTGTVVPDTDTRGHVEEGLERSWTTRPALGEVRVSGEMQEDLQLWSGSELQGGGWKTIACVDRHEGCEEKMKPIKHEKL